MNSLIQRGKIATIYGTDYLEGSGSRFFMLVVGFNFTTALLLRYHYSLIVDVCYSKAHAPKHRHRWQRDCSPCPLPESGMGTGSLGTVSCWWQVSAKVSGHVLLRWLISVLLVFTLPAAGSQDWCLFPLLQGRLERRLEAEAVWSLCFFHPLWKLQFLEMIGLLVPCREERAS